MQTMEGANSGQSCRKVSNISSGAAPGVRHLGAIGDVREGSFSGGLGTDQMSVS